VGCLGELCFSGCQKPAADRWQSGELYHTFSGHADEVVALAVVGERGETLVSVSIDCTIRQWSLKPADLAKAIDEARKAREGEAAEKEKEPGKEGLLTAEEEAELAELMEDSD
jgi:hypothetical protein